MSQNIRLTSAELAEKLNVGESTLKMWRRRYRKWIDSGSPEEALTFTEKAIERFRVIADGTLSGMAAEDIEKILAAGEEAKETVVPETPPVETEPSSDAMLNPILEMILEQQKRIAEAAERRAEAEERKADAQESRAEAERLKAQVFQEILAVLKENAAQPSVNALMGSIRSTAVETPDPVPNLTEPPTPSLKEKPEESPKKDFEEKTVPPEPEVVQEAQTEVTREAQTEIVESPPPEEPTEEALPEDMDDLSLLIDAPSSPPGTSAEKKNQPAPPVPEDMDDLSALIDSPVGDVIPEDMDDLSFLIDASDLPQAEPPEDMDDLSLLIDASDLPQAEAPEGMDDLSLLIDAPAGEGPAEDMDDLSKLIDTPAASEKSAPTPSAPTASESPEAYKARVLSRIIKMKEKDGLSIEETTRIFNEEGVKTLSGKGKWDTATISGIYSHIDSARKKT